MSVLFRLIFWGLFLAIGTQTGFGIHAMQAKMRELALRQVAKPWPTLKAVPSVDHTVNPYERKHKVRLSTIFDN